MIKSFATISVCLLLAISVGACNHSEEKSAFADLQQTTITPHLEEGIHVGRNVLYCATFQVAWNTMQDEIIKGKIILDTNPLSAKILNEQLQSKNDISEESYVVMAGELTNELIDHINKTLKDKFNEQIHVDIKKHDQKTQGKELIAFAYLDKNSQFPIEFEKLKEPILFPGDKQETKILAFGLKAFSPHQREHQKIGKQVSIIDYIDDNNFIIALASKSDNDEIILAKVKPEKTLLDTFTAVDQRLRRFNPSSMRKGETLQIPIIDFDIAHSFSELEHKRILNKGWEDWLIEKAFQEIRFKLNEKGAILKSKAIVSIMKGGGPLSVEKTRSFIFDRPFLIYLKQKKGRYPYFMLWVDNAELLLKR